MKQLTEDFVSYETAKLLKEKGFNEDCHALYDVNTEQLDIKNAGDVFNNKQWENYISAPTQSFTLKWLREVHGIHINLDIHWLHFANQNGWIYVIERILDNGVDYVDSKGDENDATFFSTYEKAVEAALKYTLENLI